MFEEAAGIRGPMKRLWGERNLQQMELKYSVKTNYPYLGHLALNQFTTV